MSIVGMTLAAGPSDAPEGDRTIYVNPARVTSLAADGNDATIVSFGGLDKVVVTGNIDAVAFKLFPDGVR